MDEKKRYLKILLKIFKQIYSPDSFFFFIESMTCLEDMLQSKPYKAIHYIQRGINKFKECKEDVLMIIVFRVFELLMKIATDPELKDF